MFIRLIKIRLGMLIRQKEVLFWSIIFPIFLSGFLYLSAMGGNKAQTAISSELQIQENVLYVEKVFKDVQEIEHNRLYFLTIIILMCYITGFTGIQEIEAYSLKASAKAVRHILAPISMAYQTLNSLCACWLFSMGCIGILLIHIRGILSITLSGNIMGWLLVIGLGTLSGILCGMIMGNNGRCKRATKQGLMAVFAVGSCILGGLVNPSIKFQMDYNFPVLSKIYPPLALIDALHTLNTYGMTQRFYKDILAIILMNAIGIGILSFLLRRNRL
ncbi:MAG: hypothetical protein E7231_16950 [Cellulosilyticum sp.]|nr:hypothetical protein [Cellulosilyticum sp.]